MVSALTPHFKLFTESILDAEPAPSWRFVLEAVDGSAYLEASDGEPGLDIDRLDLLALVRGLEALEEPSRLRLVTPSRYVRRGLSYGLEDWRRNSWRWENFGIMVPVRNADLWQRVDQALSYHQVEGKNFRVDPAHPASPEAQSDSQVVARPHFLGGHRRAAVRVHRMLNEVCQNVGWRLAQYGTPLIKSPWLD